MTGTEEGEARDRMALTFIAILSPYIPAWWQAMLVLLGFYLVSGFVAGVIEAWAERRHPPEAS